MKIVGFYKLFKQSKMEHKENGNMDASKTEFGESVDLNEKDKEFILEYQKETAALSKTEKQERYVTVIRKEGSCGFGGFGKFDYLLNTDDRNDYRVTIKTIVELSASQEEFDKVVHVHAGQKINLGCTKGGSTAWHAEYTRRIVGEKKV